MGEEQAGEATPPKRVLPWVLVAVLLLVVLALGGAVVLGDDGKKVAATGSSSTPGASTTTSSTTTSTTTTSNGSGPVPSAPAAQSTPGAGTGAPDTATTTPAATTPGAPASNPNCSPPSENPPTSFTAQNELDEWVKIIWIDQSCAEHFYKSLQHGESYTQSTFVGDKWIAKGGASGTVRSTYTVTSDGTWLMTCAGCNPDPQPIPPEDLN